MFVNIDNLSKLSQELGPVKLAKLIGVDYSHLYRVLQGEKKAGLKIISGISNLCVNQGYDVNEYIFFGESLSINKTREAS